MATTTTTEAKPATETQETQPPAAETKPPQLNMLKVLGYAADVEADPTKAAELPAEDATPATEPEQTAATEGAESAEAKPEGDDTKPRQEGVTAEETQPEQQRARKKKPSALDQLPKTEASAPVEEAPAVDPIDSAVERAMKKVQQQTAAPTLNVAELPPEDRKAIELAEFAAKTDPAKYADLPAREKAYIEARNRRVGTWVSKYREENGEDPSQEQLSEYLNSPEYRSFTKNARPSVDREALKERMLEEKFAAKAREEQAKLQQEMERKLKRIEITPIIQQAATEVQNAVLDIDDEAVKQFREDPQAALEANPVEAPIIQEFTSKARSLAAEYLEIDQGIKHADASNPLHVELDQFIEQRGQQLEMLPEDKRMRNGKVLVSPARYRQMVAKRDPNLNRVETFTSSDIVNLIQETHKGAISIRLEAHRKALEKAGYTKQRPTGQTTTAQTSAKEAAKPAAKVETTSPKSVATRAAGPSGKPLGKSVTSAIKALGYESAMK